MNKIEERTEDSSAFKDESVSFYYNIYSQNGTKSDKNYTQNKRISVIPFKREFSNNNISDIFQPIFPEKNSNSMDISSRSLKINSPEQHFPFKTRLSKIPMILNFDNNDDVSFFNLREKIKLENENCGNEIFLIPFIPNNMLNSM